MLHFNVGLSPHLVQPREGMLYQLSMPVVPISQRSVQQVLVESGGGALIIEQGCRHGIADARLQHECPSLWSCRELELSHIALLGMGQTEAC